MESKTKEQVTKFLDEATKDHQDNCCCKVCKLARKIREVISG